METSMDVYFGGNSPFKQEGSVPASEAGHTGNSCTCEKAEGQPMTSWFLGENCVERRFVSAAEAAVALSRT